MYSLGVILFELYYPFKTDMERQIEINNLKTKEDYFSSSIISHYKQEQHLNQAHVWIKKPIFLL